MLEKVRNIGIIAHVDAGKTTTTERLLYYSGTKHKSGDVDDGDTTTDFDPEEKARGVTINSAAVSLKWGETTINIIDTPGHVDFTAEVERSLRVLDGAVGVFCAVGGVEVQSETVWYQANKYKVPRIAYVNKMDRLGADFENVIGQIKSKLGAKPAICFIPWGQSDEFKGVIDLINMKYVFKDPEDPTKQKEEFLEIPDEMKQIAEDYREQLLDTVSLVDDEIAEMMLEGHEVPNDKLKAAIKRGALEMKFLPVFCGSSKNFQGVQRLLDGVVDFLPNPSEVPPVEGIVPKTKEKVSRKPMVTEPFSALAFKTVAESTGDLVYCRIYSGKLTKGDVILNTTSGKTERASRVYRMMGGKKEELDTAEAGDIVALAGLKMTFTGNTICTESAPVALESITFPEPVISQALIPDRTTDEGKLADILSRMLRDDPTLRAKTDPETNQMIISGMGELHLEVSVNKMMRFPGIKVSVGKPMVAYRQTLSKAVDFETRYIKQTGGSGKYAVIHMRYRPITKDEAAELAAAEFEKSGKKSDPSNLFFSSSIVGGSVPTEFISPVENGFRDASKKGAKYGFPVVDVAAELYDGKTHPVDSSQEAFRAAGTESFRDAQVKAGITLLEPIMKVVVIGPAKYLGDLTGDISRRRGEIVDTVMEKERCSVQANVPLAELFGYTSDLRSATSGTASFSMEFSHYSPVREELADLPESVKKRMAAAAG